MQPARDQLNPPGAADPTLVVFDKGIDPRVAGAPAPIIEVPLDLQKMRNPATAGGKITEHVKSFSEFVFVIVEL